MLTCAPCLYHEKNRWGCPFVKDRRIPKRRGTIENQVTPTWWKFNDAKKRTKKNEKIRPPQTVLTWSQVVLQFYLTSAKKNSFLFSSWIVFFSLLLSVFYFHKKYLSTCFTTKQTNYKHFSSGNYNSWENKWTQGFFWKESRHGTQPVTHWSVLNSRVQSIIHSLCSEKKSYFF